MTDRVSWRGFFCSGCDSQDDDEQSPCMSTAMMKFDDVVSDIVVDECIDVLAIEDGAEIEILATTPVDVMTVDSVSITQHSSEGTVNESMLGSVSITQHTSEGPVTRIVYTTRQRHKRVSGGCDDVLEHGDSTMTKKNGIGDQEMVDSTITTHMSSPCERRRISSSLRLGMKVRIIGTSKKYSAAIGLFGSICDIIRPTLSRKVFYYVRVSGQCTTVNSVEVEGEEFEVVVPCFSSQIQIV